MERGGFQMLMFIVRDILKRAKLTLVQAILLWVILLHIEELLYANLTEILRPICQLQMV